MKKVTWILFGVIINILPVGATILFKWGIGYEINRMDYAPDTILIALSIGGGVVYSIINELLDEKKQKDHKLRKSSNFLIMISVLLAMLFLGILYGSLMGNIIRLSSKITERYSNATETLSLGAIDELMETLEEYTTECLNDLKGAFFVKIAVVAGVVFTMIGLWFEGLKDKINNVRKHKK